jgi:hypothetical protein
MVREYYRDMLRIFKSKGAAKLPAETPREFLARIQDSYQVPYPDLITDIYVRTRFGGDSASFKDLETITLALKKLRKMGKNKNCAP